MTYGELSEDYRWYVAEVVYLLEQAQEAGFAVTVDEIKADLPLWRGWFYGYVTADTITRETGVTRRTLTVVRDA